MTVAFDAFSDTTAGTGDLSWTHTPVGTPKGIIVFVVQNVAGSEISSVTYGGTAMAAVSGSPNNKALAEDGIVYCYFLGSSIPTGAQTVTVTVSGASVKTPGAISLTASNDTTVQDTDVTINSGSSANPSSTLLLGGNTCFCAIGFMSGQASVSNIDPLTNWTIGQQFDFTSQTAGMYTYDVIGSSDVTMGWTQTADDAIAIGIAVTELAVVPTTTSTVTPRLLRPMFSGGEPHYELWLTTDTGVRIAQLTTGTMFQGSRVANGIGWLAMSMPLSFDINLIRPDRMIQLWRQPSGGAMSLWNVYFLRKWIFSTQGSQEVVTLEGPDKNDLLRRRIVAAYSGSAQASKTDFADDMMKEVVTESIADGVAPTPDAGTRVWSNLSVQADASAGPTITKSFSFDKLLSGSGSGVLAVLAEAAREAGTEVFFSVEPNSVTGSSITFQFRTTINQPGQDVTNRVIFDQARGNMREPMLEYDYSEEENYIYAAGQGEGAARNIQQVYDADRYTTSTWNRCEGFADSRNQESDDGVREAGRMQLSEGRPRIRFTAQPVDTVGTNFGLDWDFGDKVRSRYKNVEFDTIIRAVTLSVENKRETIQVRLDFEGLVT